jgi:hypothetical protein
MKINLVPRFFRDSLLDILLDLPLDYFLRLGLILKYFAVAFFPNFPKDEPWKYHPTAIKHWIDEENIMPRGDYGSNRVHIVV